MLNQINLSLLTVTGKKENRWSLATIRVGQVPVEFKQCLHPVVNYCSSRTAIFIGSIPLVLVLVDVWWQFV